MSSEGIVADPNMPVLADADLDGLYLAALEPFPYLMTPTQVAEFACGTPGGVRHLLKMGGRLKGRGWAADGWSRLRFLGLHCSFQSGADTTDDGGGTA